MTVIRTLRRPRVLIVGCGDVGLRCLERLPRARVFALTSQPARCVALRGAGAIPVVGDLDVRPSLARLAGLAPTVLHLAPPGQTDDVDYRTRALLAALGAGRRRPAGPVFPASSGAVARRRRSAIVPERAFPPGHGRHAALKVVYASTTGVYGDCGGARIDETRRVRPANARAKRRVSAERQLRRATARGALSASIARIPGIYAANRLPLARLGKGTPALIEADDVYTSHIHADDLAAILVRMATHGRPARVVHASDDSELKMGDWFDRVADVFGMARAPRVSRAEAERQLDSVLLSFMRESRRLTNRRIKRELRVRLRYPSVDTFLGDLRARSS
ncbi:NAD(P)-dependent oxidoreductase [Burkholderia sp. WAC0059]|uniref:NAD-dependent epimerase/dehydratase family protein n=1 Tax=Burkholderia sp. WAC0059 TaxID=2066022 RepID=UPI000C7F6155|nr:NAD-dependent epimerase/dehydratase family protein [Burkholderia sp. WAC0059]PLZ01225.1 NAD(P)-dependent oxidoreductase [Burkholderia sp. WAC0059]